MLRDTWASSLYIHLPYVLYARRVPRYRSNHTELDRRSAPWSVGWLSIREQPIRLGRRYGSTKLNPHGGVPAPGLPPRNSPLSSTAVTRHS